MGLQGAARRYRFAVISLVNGALVPSKTENCSRESRLLRPVVPNTVPTGGFAGTVYYLDGTVVPTL